MPHKIAFNTANLVARETDWRFHLTEWGKQDAITRERTDERAWEAICSDIAAAGYCAVEVWVAHVDPARMSDIRARAFRRILADHDLEPIGLAGPLTDETARVCQQLDIPVCNGGLWGTTLKDVHRVMRDTGLGYHYENHPERTVGAIRTAIDNGAEGVGVALDTGWLGTQGLDAPTVVRALGSLVKHVHLKDVKHAGGHETCPLGEGVVNIAATIRALADIGYTGWYSWEDEPEDRNPLEIAGAMREWISRQLDGVRR